MRVDESAQQIYLTCTGSGTQASFKILLPDGWTPLSAHAGDSPLELYIHVQDNSRYACFSGPLSGVRTVNIQRQPGASPS
jgi:hypothetical protein